MSSSSPLLEKLVSELSKLPGIGRKSAMRLSFYFLKQSKSEVEELARTLIEVKEKVRECEICFNFTESSPCSICLSKRRNRSIICVVEEPTDLMAIERSGEYKGLYHVIGGVISPLDGISPEDLHIKELFERLDSVEEVIIATNPSIEGETTTLYLQREMKQRNIKVSRIARGIPMGSALEHADQVTLVRAFEGRVEL
ncbi:MAG: recombination protein RecR [Candidatus Marinimicrobia bacterium]|nr:recombination protein RecR [Candidatus Neomarinimicrobiota bacterium]MCH7954290.1 recombination protein RecR [Candidatus Neomarinimicrobiota bacterium]